MSTNNLSEQKTNSEYTKCDNCRQDILTEKMFLHEGFCHRNNIYCDHCEKVFLKTDYEEHLKDLRNSITNSGKSTDIDENEYIPVIHEIKQTITTVVNPNTCYEFVQMPLTEEYTINSPIVISERGHILSSQNNNDYILPFLGINATKQNYRIEYGKYDYYPMNNSLNDFDYDFYRNGNNTNPKTNLINNNQNYHINNYQINLNVPNNQPNKEIKPEAKQMIKKLEKLPSDNHSKKISKKTKKIIKEEKIIKIPRDIQRHDISFEKSPARISNVKKINIKRINENTKMDNLKKFKGN